jgi:putative addiction module component (TIGR02574 family)
MHTTAKSLGLDRLSLAERLRLVEELWDSIVAEADALDVPQSHQDDLDRRLAASHAERADRWAPVPVVADINPEVSGR